MNLQLVYRYILSLSKNENGALRKKKTRSLQRRESNPGPSTCNVSVLFIAPQQLILVTLVKFIIFNTFAHEVLLVNAV